MNAADPPLQALHATERSCDVLVIGAGTVGAAIALRLKQEHRDVLLIDRECVAAQAAMMDLSAIETPLMLAAAGVSHMLRSDGALHLYESDAELRASQPGWDARADHGIAFTHLHGPAALSSAALRFWQRQLSGHPG